MIVIVCTIATKEAGRHNNDTQMFVFNLVIFVLINSDPCRNLVLGRRLPRYLAVYT